MEKINVIVPILKENKNFVANKRKLLKILKKFEKQDLIFEVFFVANHRFEKPKYYHEAKNTQFIFSNAKKKNDLIEKAYAKITDGASLIVNPEFDDLEEIIHSLLTEREKDAIVRVIKAKPKNILLRYLKMIPLAVYSIFLKLFYLEKDLLCDNGFQYFNENATQVIKSLPEKNAYMRNFNSLIGYKNKTVEIEHKKIKFLDTNDLFVIVSFISLFFGFLFLIGTFYLSSLILTVVSGFVLYNIMLSISIIIIFLSLYGLIKSVIKLRANF